MNAATSAVKHTGGLPDSECSDQRAIVIVARNHLAWTTMSYYCITIPGINPNESTEVISERTWLKWSTDQGCLEKESGSELEVLHHGKQNLLYVVDESQETDLHEQKYFSQ